MQEVLFVCNSKGFHETYGIVEVLFTIKCSAGHHDPTSLVGGTCKSEFVVFF